MNIRQIAPNAVSGSYTFDMHQTSRTPPPVSPRPKGTAAEAGRPRPISDPITSRIERSDSSSPKKLHRKSRSVAASQPGARTVSNPFDFEIPKRTTLPQFTPSRGEPGVMDAPEQKAERRRSLGATFSFLQSWNGRDRLGSRSSTSSTKSVASTSGSEDGEVMERGPGSELVHAAQKQKQAQSQTPTTYHNTGLYFPIVRPDPPLASNNNPSAPANVVPRSLPTVARPGYHKAQTKKVLKHARAELMKEVRKLGYNDLVVEG